MSTQKGNSVRSRSQKYKNCTKFKNDKYNSTKETKNLNSMTFEYLCQKCEAIIEWKIRYKKYKPLTVPSKCTRCEEKAVKSAYHNICNVCAKRKNVCAKCGENWTPEQNGNTEDES